MTTIFSVLFFLLAAFSFSFVLWKKLREDYENDKIFKFTIYIFVGLVIGWWIAVVFAPKFSFWITVFTPFLAGSYVHRQLGLKFFETIDAFAPSWFSFLFFSYSGLLLAHLLRLEDLNIKYSTWFVFAEVLLTIGSIVFYKYALARYRKFSWYPSGKVGFAGLTSLAGYFMIRSLINFIASIFSATQFFKISSVIVSVEVVNGIIGLIVSGVILYVLYLRSGRR